MSFSLSITGDMTNSDTAESDEQAFVDALRKVVKDHDPQINYATGNFAFSGTVDLLAGTDTEPPPPPPPPTFVTKVDGESYADYQARLFSFNADNPDHQVPAPFPTEEEWLALPVG